MADRPWVSYEEIKDTIGLPEVLDKLGVPTDQFKRTGDKLTGICPIHEHGPVPNKTGFKATKKDSRWQWFCFGDCSRGGSVIDLVMLHQQLDIRHAGLWFYEQFGERLTAKRPKAGSETKEARADVIDPTRADGESPNVDDSMQSSNIADPSKPLKPLSFKLNLDVEAALPYLTGRGFREATIRDYGVGLATRKGMFQGYICLPVYRWPGQPDENPIGYCGRFNGDDYSEDDGRPRYKLPPEFPATRLLFGIRHAVAAGNDTTPLIVVEGGLKTMWLSQCGFRNTVGTFTAAVSDEQANLLISLARPVVLMFDGGDREYEAMIAASAKLLAHTAVRIIRLDVGVQPTDLDADALHGLLPDAVPLPVKTGDTEVRIYSADGA